MKFLVSFFGLCYSVTLTSSQNSYGQQPGNYFGGGQQQMNRKYHWGGQNPTYNYGGGQQPMDQNYYWGGQNANYNYGGGQNTNYQHAENPMPQVACDPPKCEPGCSLQTVYDGPCPGCECNGDKPMPQIACDPPNCGPGCSLQTVYDGPCPGCDCNEGGQNPNYNYYYGGGQQRMDGNYYPGGQNRNYHYGGGQQPNNYYGGGQQPYNYGGCKQIFCASFCGVGIGPDGCPECVCVQN